VPARTGVVIGIVTKTPVRLMFALLPLKNLFASGSQMLTGQHKFVLCCLRCSITVPIVQFSLPTTLFQRPSNRQSQYRQISTFRQKSSLL
jgi:hypothetical protein